MRDLVRLFWTLFGLVFLAACVLTLYDWVCDNLDVVRMAEQEACADEADGCRAQMTMLMRSPITQSFEFAETDGPRGRSERLRHATKDHEPEREDEDERRARPCVANPPETCSRTTSTAARAARRPGPR